MSDEDKLSELPMLNTSNSHMSPPPTGIRHRPLGRAATFAEPSGTLSRRRSSLFSESFSETKKSLQSSTDDLLLPKITSSSKYEEQDETTHWHSLPLGVALLPAVGGLFFKDGSAIITDVTLLALAAIFMNWALRMPWEWYRAAQAVVVAESTPAVFTPTDEEDNDTLSSTDPSATVPETANHRARLKAIQDESRAAEVELKIHELTALVCCFAFPALAAWLLHAIRSQLSRPSEGLVSNYNLTIFLLVAEIRPVSHLIKMIQRRTLYLKRQINIEALQSAPQNDQSQVAEINHRLEELEAHVASGIAAADEGASEASDSVIVKVTAQASSELRKSVQPELDALSRAMRRYEKRSTISAVQIEARLQDLEIRLKDVVVLAAAAQRNAEQQPRNYIVVVTNWICAAIVVPVQVGTYFLSLPSRLTKAILGPVLKYVPDINKSKRQRDQRPVKRVVKPAPGDRERRNKTPAMMGS